MDKEKVYTIYLLTSPSGKKYCGYTSQQNLVRRWNNGHGYKRCPAIWNAICKYGWLNFTKEIIFQTTDQQMAFDKEKEVISKLQLQDPKYGYNIDIGGRPHGGGDHLTVEGRKKISEIHKKLWADPEYRAHMVEQAKKHPPTRECIEKGKIASSKAHKGQIPHNVCAVIQIDKDTNKEIQRFISATHAARAVMGEDMGCSNILNVCRGKRKTAYGYKWRFADEDFSD